MRGRFDSHRSIVISAYQNMNFGAETHLCDGVNERFYPF